MPPTQPPPRTPTGGKGERILFVDDEQSIVFVGRRLLELSGYQVTTTTDPRSALELFSAAPAAFDLVITDLTMPGMTGLELAALLRDVRPDVPIIITTGHVHGIGAGHEALGVCILLKPFDLDVLTQTVADALAGR